MTIRTQSHLYIVQIISQKKYIPIQLHPTVILAYFFNFMDVHKLCKYFSINEHSVGLQIAIIRNVCVHIFLFVYVSIYVKQKSYYNFWVDFLVKGLVDFDFFQLFLNCSKVSHPILHFCLMQQGSKSCPAPQD